MIRMRVRNRPVGTSLRRIRESARVGGFGASGRKTFWWAFVMLMGLSTAWTVATPLMGVPDEPAHVIKAAAVVRGELAGREKPGVGTFRFVDVPAGIAYFDTFGCFAQQPEVTPACVPPFRGDPNELVEGRTSAGNYNPVYYFLTGLPSLVTTGSKAVYGMRLVNSLVSCFFLALAFAALSQMRLRKWAMVATAVSVTPMVLFLNGAVNPNSLEYATGAALLASFALLLERSGEPSAYPRLVLVITASACLLANSKGLSLLWLALMVATACLLGTWTQLRALARNPWVWGGTSVIGLASAFALYWVVGHDSLASNPFEAAGISPAEGFEIMMSRTLLYSTAYIGQFGWLEVPASVGAIVLWLGLAAVLVLSAAVLGRGRPRAATIFLLAALLLLPPILQAQAVETMGIVWQGRYILAVFVPLLIVSGMALDRVDAQSSHFSAPMAVSLKGMALLLAFLHFWTYAETLQRYVKGWGGDHPWPDMLSNPSWQPPGGTMLCLIFFGATLALTLWMIHLAIDSERRAARVGVPPLAAADSAD